MTKFVDESVDNLQKKVQNKNIYSLTNISPTCHLTVVQGYSGLLQIEPGLIPAHRQSRYIPHTWDRFVSAYWTQSVMNQHTKMSELLLDFESESEDEELISLYLINNIKRKSITHP